MKLSKLIKGLEYSLDTYGDLDVVISIDGKFLTKPSADSILDVPIDFIQDIPDRNIVSLQNFPY